MEIPYPTPKHYFPVSKNDFAFTAGLKLVNLTNDNILQIDDQYTSYMYQKNKNRQQQIHQYICEKNVSEQIKNNVILFLIKHLEKEWSQYFYIETTENLINISNQLNNEVLVIENHSLTLKESTNHYLDTLDAIISQLQEDFAIVETSTSSDQIVYLHLNFPNFWSAQDKIGESFLQVHSPVPGMDKINKHHQSLNKTLCSQGPFERFTWGITTNTNLNQHPSCSTNTAREFDQAIKQNDLSQLYLRTERQVTVPFKQAGFYLFIIRTYFSNLAKASNPELSCLIHSLKTMPPNIAKYKGLSQHRSALISLIKQTINFNNE